MNDEKPKKGELSELGFGLLVCVAAVLGAWYNHGPGFWSGLDLPEWLVRTLIIGAFFGIIGGVAVWVRSIWRKRNHN